MTFSDDQVGALNAQLCQIIEGNGTALDLITAASNILPFSAALVVVNRRHQNPVHLGDTYPQGPAKTAVQRYISTTYLLNPLYNAYLDGLAPGLHAMTDLAPDNWPTNLWFPDLESAALETAPICAASAEEIGYRTLGWPTGLQELALTVALPQKMMGEISFARPTSMGGFPPEIRARLLPFYPLFATAFRSLWARQQAANLEWETPQPQLGDFAADLLSPRECEVIQMVLKGHSSPAISLCLGIALPTVKSHRKNAYAKLGISTQLQLFSAFIVWQSNLLAPK